MTKTPDKIELSVLENEVLGVRVVRGYAPLYLLSLISEADVYDAQTNPTGTQRDLSPKHARDAYEYIRTEKLAYWPEIFLSVREKSAIKLEAGNNSISKLTINTDYIRESARISISRVDGNHRLHYASGEHEGYPPIEKAVSFCLAVSLSLDDEIKLFRDINNNQRRMNTSHLDNIKARLSGQDELALRDPYLWIAKKLSDDADSPFQGVVYEGGKGDAQKFIPLRNLKSGIAYMFSRPTRLTAIDNVQVQLKLIKNYFVALKNWAPEAWEKPKEFVLLRGAGFWGACFLGAEVIDRCLAANKFVPSDMLKLLKSGSRWDWSRGGDFQGFSGRAGAVKIRDMIVTDLPDAAGVSLKALAEQIATGIPSNRFYVNANAQPDGRHEVHRAGCSYLPSQENRVDLGIHDDCSSALTKASQIYGRCNGCYYCSSECHNA